MAKYSDVLLTVDYDRTLTAPDATIPERNLEAIRYFIENGGAFTVNSGRGIPMTRRLWDTVPVNIPWLLYNGSADYDVNKKKLVYCQEIDLDMWQVVRDCQRLFPDLTVEIQGVDAHYCFSENPGWEAFSKASNCAYAYAKPGDDLGPFIKFTLYGQFHDTTIDQFFSGTEEEVRRMDEAEKLLNEHFGEHCAVFRAAPRIIDVQTKNISKGNAARHAQKVLKRRILVCVGDAENDLTMLDSADYSFCPSDGIVADRYPNVCPCAEGAVADVIYKKIPELP